MAVEKNLKHKTLVGMVWNAVQRFGSVLLSFISNLVLARLLLPEDFGCIGMLTIFIALSTAFIDGGFGAALIQKKDVSQVDYSTVFYWNLFISFVFFILLMVGAPLIAEFYHMPSLCDVLRGMSFVLILNAFSVIQTNILTKQLAFKQLAKINLLSTLVGVIVAIVLAYLGFGVWSLVAKALVTALLTGVLLWIVNSWRPTFAFSWTSFKSLFSFGGLMLLSTLMNTLLENIQGLVIGRVYTATDMGYYSQAKKLDELPSNSVSQIVNQVSFPVFSKISDDLHALKNAFRKNVLCTSFLLFPLQVLLIVLAEPIIIFLFSDKWIESVVYFRILCFYSMFVALNALNTNIFKSLGKSGVFFVVQFVKKALGILLLIVALHYGGIIGVTWSVSISGILWWFISSTVNKRVISYGLWGQFKDILPSILISAFSGLMVYLVFNALCMIPIYKIISVSSTFVIVYLLTSKFFNKEPYSIFREIVISGLERIKRKREARPEQADNSTAI